MGISMVLDCDPGRDDAIAIMLAAAGPAVDLLAITTVAGNQTVEKVMLNARRVCTAAGIHVRPELSPLPATSDGRHDGIRHGPLVGQDVVVPQADVQHSRQVALTLVDLPPPTW
jgi:purine nucleosidase/pyrimidine-specific ribonucleoside hydrolase